MRKTRNSGGNFLEARRLMLPVTFMLAATANAPSWWVYHMEHEKTAAAQRALQQRVDGNGAKLPVMRRMNDLRHENLTRIVRGEEIADSMEISAEEGGQWIWIRLRNVLADNDVPFKRPYLDPDASWAIGQGLRERAGADPELRTALEEHEGFLRGKWAASLDADTVRRTVAFHAREELEITREVEATEALAEEGNKRVQRARWVGLATAAAEVALVAFASWLSMALGARRKMATRRREAGAATENAPKGKEEAPQPNESGRTNGAPRGERNGSGNAQQAAAQNPGKRKGKHRKREELLEHASAILGGLLSEGQWGLINRTLNEQLSTRILLDIIEGDLGSLAEAVERNRPALREKYAEIARALEMEEGSKREGTPQAAKGWATGYRRRKHHPLDGIKRGGLTGSSLHHLLSVWGFEATDGTGGGHLLVRYRITGEIIRHSDHANNGRPVVIVGRGSGKVSPGLARNVLDACAAFLVKLEEEPLPKII